jgi:hypothetical protein
MVTGPDYQASKGEISKFDLDIKGKGFSPPNLQRYLRGGMEMDMKDLSFSNNLKSLYFLEIIFLPIEILSDIKKFIPNLSVSNDLSKSVAFSRDILNSASNLKFNTGRIALKADECLKIEELLLKGDFVRSLAISGFIGYDGTLHIDSDLNVNRVILPVSIDGSIHAPQPNMKKFIAAFLKDNTVNILDPENLKGSLQSLGKRFRNIDETGKDIEKESEKEADDEEADLNKTIKKTRKLFDLFLKDDDKKRK